MKQKLKNLWQFFIRIIQTLNRWRLAVSFQLAKWECEGSNKKMWIVLVNGNYKAMTKEHFKRSWRGNTPAKKLSIQEWEHHITEYKKKVA